MPRQCPFCKEDIKEDAIKCKHCQSLLYKIEPEEIKKADDGKGDSKYVTYVLDKDLVRFAKFALSVLAIFITIGIILYGVDLKQTAKELGEANSNLQEAHKKLSSSLPKIDSLESKIDSIRGEVEDARSKASEALAEINSRREEAILLVGSIRSLSPEQLEKLSKIRDSAGGQFATLLDFNNLWKAGQTLRIFFLNGTQIQREKVVNIALEWTKYANLKFKFIGDAGSADVRITFEKGGTWSYVGTNCLAIPHDQPTMGLSISVAKAVLPFDRTAILREFGHTLGLLNEEQNPNGNIKWNREKVMQFYGGTYAWDRQTIENNLFTKWKSKSKPFDPQSIMMTAISKDLTTDGFHTELQDHLSSIDREFIGRLYPK